MFIYLHSCQLVSNCPIGNKEWWMKKEQFSPSRLMFITCRAVDIFLLLIMQIIQPATCSGSARKVSSCSAIPGTAERGLSNPTLSLVSKTTGTFFNSRNLTCSARAKITWNHVCIGYNCVACGTTSLRSED